MKYKYLLLAIFSCMFYQCATQNKVTYNIPADYPEARRKQIIEIFNKGKELYKVNCSECHGIYTKGKDNIPNFSTKQFDNYVSSFIMRDLKNHAVAVKMTPEELKETLLFLRFLKRKVVDSAVAKT